MDVSCSFLDQTCVIAASEDETIGSLKRRILEELPGGREGDSSDAVRALSLQMKGSGVDLGGDGVPLSSTTLGGGAHVELVRVRATLKAPFRYLGRYMSVAVSDCGTRLARGGDDQLSVWDTVEGEELFALTMGGGRWCRGVSYSKCGTEASLASAWDDGKVRVYDSSGACTHTLHDVARPPSLYSVCFTRCGRVVSAGNTTIIHVWNLSTGTLEKTCTDVTVVMFNHINKVAVTDKFILAAARHKTIRMWGLTSDEEHSLQGHEDVVTDVTVSDCGGVAVTGSEDKTCRVWDLLTKQCTRILQGHTSNVNSVALSTAGGFIASCSYDKLLFFDLGSGEQLSVDRTDAGEGGCKQLAVTCCGGWLFKIDATTNTLTLMSVVMLGGGGAGAAPQGEGVDVSGEGRGQKRGWEEVDEDLRCSVCGAESTQGGVRFASQASVRKHANTKHKMLWSAYLESSVKGKGVGARVDRC